MASHSLLSNEPTYKVYCQHGPNFHLTIRYEKVVLAPSDPSDKFQNWHKVERGSLKLKDKQLFSCFALVNKASGQAIKANVDTKQLELIPYNPDVVDESVLWSETHDLGDGYRAIWTTANVHLNLDAFGGEDPIKNGTPVWLWKWHEGHNQRWKFTPQSLKDGGSPVLKGGKPNVTDMKKPQSESSRRYDKIRKEFSAVCARIVEANSKSAADEAVQQLMEILKREVNEFRNDLNELRLKELAEANATSAAMQKQIVALNNKLNSSWCVVM
ncbi:ricin B-like lectin R40G3 [Mercurialis annua]|uniref:ricin B-like lectin R40G3 n=1 Tax=Mercurialis annua TaxID=3986 RepID=UPI0021608BB8|nr:ricin B-like lectin R40G3 [Mercurialis annua]